MIFGKMEGGLFHVKQGLPKPWAMGGVSGVNGFESIGQGVPGILH